MKSGPGPQAVAGKSWSPGNTEIMVDTRYTLQRNYWGITIYQSF